jgi:hypothetical protein
MVSRGLHFRVLQAFFFHAPSLPGISCSTSEYPDFILKPPLITIVIDPCLELWNHLAVQHLLTKPQ